MDKCKPDRRISTCDCCVESLRKLICKNFSCGDIIGITFVFRMGSEIFCGRFKGVYDGVVIIDDLFTEGITSFIPLCEISSVEKGYTTTQCGTNPIPLYSDK